MSDLIERMAADLRRVKVNLNDERAVFGALQAMRYTAGEILKHGDAAVALARPTQKNLLSIAGDAVAMAFAAAVLLAWYCVLCPPQVLS